MTAKRFWANVRETDSEFDCWEWQGYIMPNGYGRSTWMGIPQGTHRIAYMLANNENIPSGMRIDHMCRNRSCCNPAHLRLVTHRINSIENSVGPTAINHQKTHCVNGHPLSGANLLVEEYEGTEKRRCRECQAIKKRAYKARQKALKQAA